MHGAWVGWDKLDRVMLSPLVGPGPGVRYLIRTQPGQLDAVMTAVESALRKRDPNRVVGKLRTVQNFKQSSYASDSLTAVTLSVVTGLVLIFSALGIFSLATFNVNTRTRQSAPGVRSARKRDIVSYFAAENGWSPRSACWWAASWRSPWGTGCRTSSACRASTFISSSAESLAFGSWGSWQRGSPHCGRPRSHLPWPLEVSDSDV
jgi:hypothetical protein